MSKIAVFRYARVFFSASSHASLRQAMLGLCVSLGLIGCTATPQGNGYASPPIGTTPKVSAAEDCPSGAMKVCDRRKPIGCQCRSARHIRALIGA